MGDIGGMWEKADMEDMDDTKQTEDIDGTGETENKEVMEKKSKQY